MASEELGRVEVAVDSKPVEPILHRAFLFLSKARDVGLLRSKKCRKIGFLMVPLASL
jgi:hypothetical protein